MSRKKPDRVFDVDGMVVLARSGKGAISVAREHGKAVDRSYKPEELPEGRKSDAVNKRE